MFQNDRCTDYQVNFKMQSAVCKDDLAKTTKMQYSMMTIKSTILLAEAFPRLVCDA